LEYQKEARSAQTKGVICKAFNRQITQEENLVYEKFRQQFPRIFYPKFQFLNADFSGIEDCRLYNLYNYWKYLTDIKDGIFNASRDEDKTYKTEDYRWLVKNAIKDNPWHAYEHVQEETNCASLTE